MNQLTIHNISKSFGSTTVLKNVSLTIHAGEVHALLGTNGAGKSTLMKIVCGDYERDSGSISYNGQPLSIRTPSDAKKAGIGIVVQEVDTALFPALSVAENIWADSLNQSPFKLYSSKKERKKTKQLLATLGIPLNPDKLASDCTLSEKQLILIARAMAHDVQYLILDEPTAPLSIEETQLLFHLINKLKKKGVGIIYISHRMPEIEEISDRFTILRDGKVHLTTETKAVSADEIITNMLGSAIGNKKERKRQVSNHTLFRAENVHVPETGKNINLELNHGEIIGVAGLVGAGKSETALALFGASKPQKGKIHLHNRTYRFRSPSDAIDAGVCLIPEERRKTGILLDFSLSDNLTLPSLRRHSKNGLLNRKKEENYASNQINQLGIKASSTRQPIHHLSGGNQQKAAIGKWLDADRNVFLFDEPTKGIDIKAKTEVLSLIKHLADEGKGILYFSSEIDELLEISDKILVMYDGEITATLTGDNMNQSAIMQAATGGTTIEISS
ncbi:ATP-binding cassette domain-containing protein [Bacillus hwajinpoensis]|uniref:Autoinducer 2 import ATP-binding protein LsrA n=1 Tax=Guptibacillus hwajinpoensis TaxID=208199 RepID=A0A845F4D8_9BACL|nr:sugar ABC transporter ATP-binding protein [Pseudalkalibacillus hwajinpoensis]MYL65641.1 ATP-binding cassette domain-containing protein [Pseudalkalibacillus hwajinpoensis]